MDALFSNEFSQHYWQESFDGDSFVSQSRFDAYAIPIGSEPHYVCINVYKNIQIQNYTIGSMKLHSNHVDIAKDLSIYFYLCLL